MGFGSRGRRVRPRASSPELEREEIDEEEMLRLGWVLAAVVGGEAPYKLASGTSGPGAGSAAVVEVVGLPAMATSRSESPVPERLTLVLLLAASVAPPMKPFS